MFACRPPTGRLQAHGAGASQPSSAPFATSSTSGRAAKSAAAAAAAASDSGMRDCQSAQSNSSSSSSSAPWSVAAATSSGAVAASAPVSAGRGTTSSLRVAKDLIELGRDKMTAAASTRISFPDGQKNLRRLQVLLTPHSGLYAHASFLFTLIIPPQYPFQPPNVRCHTPCLHPNINWRTGKVYLHLLKAEWKPVLSINTVLFALQLLFLEPWPSASASAHSATASSMPPARPTLTASHSASVVPTSDPSQATPSALSLAASRSAAASSLHQLDEGGILNLDIYRLIVGGERAVFEELVRKTLDGGFFFGALWPRNRAAQHDSDSEGEDDDDGGSDDERERFRRVRSPSPVDESRYDPRHMFSSSGGGGDDSTSSFNALLQRVEQNGRQAHVGAVDSQPQQQRQFHQRDRRRVSRDDHAMDSDSDGHSGVANGAVAPAHKLQSQPNGSKGLQKRCKRLLHRKRAHRLISSSDAHEHNPAASLCASSPSTRMLLPGADAADLPTHVHKRIRSQQLALEELQQQQQPTAAAGASTTLRVAATSRRRFIQLRPLHVTAGSSGRAPATRKRPSPLPASLSDGEYEDAAEAEVAAAAALIAPRRNPSPTAAQDDSSAVPRRRRAKKQFRPAASEDDPFGMDAASSVAASANGRPRPSSTVLPDLASFASFHPTSPPLPLGRSVSPPHATAVASLSDGAQSSNSPKRNVSDCGSLMPALLTLDERGAGASFILHGRSSSRSLNLFGSGPVKAQVAHAGAGLADLQDLQASLPAAAPNAMAD